MRYNNLSLLFALLICACGGKEEGQQKLKPQVTVVKSFTQSVIIEQDFVGQVYGRDDIPISSRIAGFIQGIHFDEGGPVKKGQLLYTIDQQPSKAALSNAESNLAEANTLLVLAQNELNRIAPLAKKNAVSQSDYDAALAERDARMASVRAAEAKVEIEEINLSYTEIRAPVDGIIGKTEAKVGEYVGAYPNVVQLNTVSNVETVVVEFFITESDYLYASRQRELVDGDVNERQISIPPKLVLSDGTVYEETGSFSFINRQIDASTGSILIQTEFPNTKRLLRPGQFSRVRVAVTDEDNAVLIPQRCLMELQGLFFVYTVNDQGVIVQKKIEKGEEYKDYVVVKSGLSANEKVVLEGSQFVRNGVPVDAEEVQFESQFEEGV